MAFRRSNILNQIAQGGNASPITAFLVGRENKRQRERQENRDAQLDTQFGQQSELNTLKIDAIKGEPARLQAEKEAELAATAALAEKKQQQSLLVAKGIFDNPDIPSEKKSMAIQMIMSGDDNAAKEALDLIQDELKPNRRQQIETGTPGSFGTDAQRGKQQIELETQVAAVNAFGAQSSRLLKTINSVPGANTLTAKFANVGNRVANEVRTLASSLKVEFELGDSAFDVNEYEETFKASGLAGASPRIKNGFLGLAIQRAMAMGLGAGRALSDFDIKQQLMTLGTNQSDPKIVAQLFEDSFSNLEDTIKFKHQATPGLRLPNVERPDFGLGGSSDSGASDAPEGVAPDVWAEMTPEERAPWN